MQNCLDCPQHSIIPDPDPDDWFNSDDQAVVCTLTANPRPDASAKYMADRNPYKAVTVSCRPYRTRKESERPNWCPIIDVTPVALEAPAGQAAGSV